MVTDVCPPGQVFDSMMGVCIDNPKPLMEDPWFNPPIHSSVKAKGKYVTEVITGTAGYKKTFRGVDTDSIMQGEFTHFETKDGRKVMVNTKNVLFVEVESE